MTQQQPANAPQEETAVSGWDLIKKYAENAKADTFLGRQRYEHQTAEGFRATVSNFDGRPDITVNLASVAGGRGLGYAVINLTMVFKTTDDGCTLFKPVYCLEIEQLLPGAVRTCEGVEVSNTHRATITTKDLSSIWKHVSIDPAYAAIAAELEVSLRKALAGTRYEQMMFDPPQQP